MQVTPSAVPLNRNSCGSHYASWAIEYIGGGGACMCCPIYYRPQISSLLKYIPEPITVLGCCSQEIMSSSNPIYTNPAIFLFPCPFSVLMSSFFGKHAKEWHDRNRWNLSASQPKCCQSPREPCRAFSDGIKA